MINVTTTLLLQSKQHLVLVGAAALVFLIALTGFFAISQWQKDWQLTHMALPKAGGGGNNINTLDNLVAAIPSQHLFGQSLTGDHVPVTHLQMRVTGIVKMAHDSDNRHSKAAISVAGQPSKLYRIGDTLPAGIKVYDITATAVILDNHGQLEKLPLPRERVKFKSR
ncbi:MAG TPA: type II secretion system protein N [Gammaproteobacteria bacterium]|jgi:general secretion pathway protein C|nr:type II secretion system protein N [Gammaproteobacteria bacterium]